MSARLRDGEEGAVAIVWALVIAFVMAPLAGLALTTYVRGGVAAELQRAADSGALAGAAVIPLGNLGYLNAYLSATSAGPTTAVGTTLATLLPAGPANPLTVACEQALRVLATGDGFGSAWAEPNGAPTCTAKYLNDASLGAALQQCVSSLASPVLPLLGGLTMPDLTQLLPALLHPGIEVALAWRVRGPLDELVDPGGDPTTHTTSARAVRRFKDVVVVPTVAPNKIPFIGGFLGPLGVPAVIDLNPVIASVQSTLFTNLRTTISQLEPLLNLRGCGGIVSALEDDLYDINPNTSAQTPPSVSDVINGSRDSATPLLTLRIPADPTNFLKVPFLDFVPVCVNAPPGATTTPLPTSLPAVGSLATCSAATPGAFRASLVSS